MSQAAAWIRVIEHVVRHPPIPITIRDLPQVEEAGDRLVQHLLRGEFEDVAREITTRTSIAPDQARTLALAIVVEAQRL